MYGTSCSQNDIGVLNLSRLVIHVENLLHPDYVMPFGLLPALYGNAVFQANNYSTIISRYELIGDANEINLLSKINFRMSGVRQSIEHMYGQLFNLFRLLKTPRQFKLFNDGNFAYCVGVVCFFLLNCYTCFNGSPCNSMFSTTAPTIEQYLSLDEVLAPYIDNNQELYNFYVLN